MAIAVEMRRFEHTATCLIHKNTHSISSKCCESLCMLKVAGHKLFWCLLVQYNSHFYINLTSKFVNMSRTGNKIIGECRVYRRIS